LFYHFSISSKINADIAVNELITPLEQRRLKYAKKKMEFGSRQDEVTAPTQSDLCTAPPCYVAVLLSV
jgi:hypothetical protein